MRQDSGSESNFPASREPGSILSKKEKDFRLTVVFYHLRPHLSPPHIFIQKQQCVFSEKQQNVRETEEGVVERTTSGCA